MANEEHVAILRQGVDVWNRWREEHPQVKPDLQEADLQGVILRKVNLAGTNLQRSNLAHANLQVANLAGVNFQSANLIGASLQRAVLTVADFTRSNLRSADLYWANITGADLSEADLSGANLYGANLTAANLTRVNGTQMKIGRTIFGDVNLREVRSLDTAQHEGPSIIGIDTLYHSQGDIPEAFLRGCGVPEPMIEYARSLITANNSIQFYSVFISYSHADTSFARRLYDALQGRGIRCWLDEHQVLPGHSIYDEVDRGIRLWDKVLLCASKDSLTSWWVHNELNKAFTKEQQLMKDRGTMVRALIPLNLDNTLWQWQDGKADEVRSRLAADFTGWEHDNAKFEREFEKLVRALRTDEGREVPPLSRL